MVTEPCFTVKVTVPTLTAGPVVGVTVALSVTEPSPYVAAAFDAVVVVFTVGVVTTRVPAPPVLTSELSAAWTVKL